MPRVLKFKGYPTGQIAALTGAERELIIDTTTDTLTVHDGITVGGTRLASEAFVNATLVDVGITPPTVIKGDTASRPVLAFRDAGRLYFDISLSDSGKPIWWNGIYWIDSTGEIA